MQKTKLRSARVPHTRVHPDLEYTSMTKQSFQGETNINSIMKKYQKTGLIEHVNEHRGEYADFLNAPDYHTALNRVIEANDMFASLPSELRTRFDNDPGKFLSFVDDEENIPEMKDMGLIPKAPVAPTEPKGEPEGEVPPPPETPPEDAPEAS